MQNNPISYNPQPVEVEQLVLGAILLDKHAITQVADILKPECFYQEAHQVIYEAMLRLSSASDPIDLMTVISELRKMGKYEVAGSSKNLMVLTTKVYSSANIEKHAYIVLEAFMKREVLRVCDTGVKSANDPTQDVFELLNTVEGDIMAISGQGIKKDYVPAHSILVKTTQELEARSKKKDGITGVPSGFVTLDAITAGWQSAELVIIAGRPAMGKTAFVLSMLRNIVVEHSVPAVIFSLEMSNTELMFRLLSMECRIESNKFKQGKLSESEWADFSKYSNNLAKAPLFIDDTPALSIRELRAKCRRLKAKEDIQLIVVDYLQLMQGETLKNGNREQEIASISRGLKTIAKELDVPVIALSQLSRAVETRGGDKRPMLSDLRESGSLEQDADKVMFLYRPEYYGLTEDMDGNPTQGIGEVIIAKHRSGDLGTLQMRFEGKYTLFSDLSATFFDMDITDFESDTNTPNPLKGDLLEDKQPDDLNPDFATNNDEVPF